MTPNEEISETMQETPNGENYGRAQVQGDDGEWGLFPLDVAGWQAADVLTDEGATSGDPAPFGSGYGIIDPTRGQSVVGSYGATDMGLTAHRGVLHGDEYVDFFALREQVEAEFGYTYAAIAATYKNGRPTAEQRQQREEIDARMLALSRAGGNMAEFAKAVGLSEKTVDRALARARERHVEEIVKAPARTTILRCFKCYEPGRRRKRRHSLSPPELVGTVVLCDEHYAAGFVPKRGVPQYTEPIRNGVKPGPARPKQKFPADWPSEESYREFVAGTR